MLLAMLWRSWACPTTKSSFNLKSAPRLSLSTLAGRSRSAASLPPRPSPGSLPLPLLLPQRVSACCLAKLWVRGCWMRNQRGT